MSGIESRELVLTPFASIRSRRQRWLWSDRVPLGVVSVFAGYGGEGKSTFALHLAAKLNQGQLEGDLHGTPRPVLIVSHEDDLATVMKPRLIAAGADSSMVYHLTIRSKIDEITTETIPAMPEDAPRIRQALADTGAGLIIIDPITSTMSGDLHKVADVRAALNPVAAIAQEADVAVIAIMHLNKSGGSLSSRLSGSHAFRDVSRSVLVFARDEDTGNRIVTLDKANYSETIADSFAFAIRSTEITTDDGDRATVGTVDYLGDTDLDVQSILDRARDDDSEDRSEAERWIIGYLEDHGGTAPAGEIQKAARSDGMSWDSLKRASTRIVDKAKSGYQGRWLWTLNLGKESGKGAKSAKGAESTPFALNDDGNRS